MLVRRLTVLFLIAAACWPQDLLLLHNATMIDGASDMPIPNASVLIRQGRIVSVTRGTTSAHPGNARMIDLTGYWILPGLIDAHYHPAGLKDARFLVGEGVTTIRTMNAESYLDVGIRALHEGGMADLPEVVAGGYQLRPDMFVFEGFFLTNPTLVDLLPSKVSGPQNVRRLVQANVKHGVNHIKILATERGGTPDTDPARQTFSEPDLVAIVDEARKAGLPVAAHAHGDEGGAAAVRAGVRTIEHGSLLKDATLDLMKERGTCLVPTIALGEIVPKTPFFQTMSAEFRERSLALWSAARSMVSRAWRKGVPIVAGTDANPNNLFSVAKEVEALAKAGLPPMEAIKAATSRSATCLGLERRTGMVKPGMEADLLVVKENPLEDPSALQKVVLVVNDGVVVVNRLAR